VGIWGPIIETWLHALLPENAHEICSGSVHIQVLTERGQSMMISKFESKAFLVEILLASTHIPLVLDGKMFRSVEGKRYLDGFILGEVPGGATSLVLSFPEHVSRVPIVKMIDLDTARAHIKFGMDTLPSSVFFGEGSVSHKALHCVPMLLSCGALPHELRIVCGDTSHCVLFTMLPIGAGSCSQWRSTPKRARMCCSPTFARGSSFQSTCARRE